MSIALKKRCFNEMWVLKFLCEALFGWMPLGPSCAPLRGAGMVLTLKSGLRPARPLRGHVVEWTGSKVCKIFLNAGLKPFFLGGVASGDVGRGLFAPSAAFHLLALLVSSTRYCYSNARPRGRESCHSAWRASVSERCSSSRNASGWHLLPPTIRG